MENDKSIPLKKHKLVCEDRKTLLLNGITKVESTSETQVICALSSCLLQILGKNLHVKKLDVNEGILDIEGEIEQVKYNQEKKPFFKRIFK